MLKKTRVDLIVRLGLIIWTKWQIGLFSCVSQRELLLLSFSSEKKALEDITFQLNTCRFVNDSDLFL